MIKKPKKATISQATIVQPTGVDANTEINIPKIAHTTEIILADIKTDLNVLNTLIADSAGKMIKADINNEPTKFIASTMTTAVMIAIR